VNGEIGRGLVQQSSVAASISPALFFISFFWASKRKKIENTAHRCIFFLQFSLMKNFFSNSAKNKALNHSNVQLN